ncbi:MAG: hypothetical protein JWM87_690 [Candidatus Eremiobacteraeota bacterium]|nr:hypothetical protein [Candidatus Eremiobacteraeota bacterium]
MSLLHTITVTCDYPVACDTKFGPKSDKQGEAKTEARDAGWYIGRDDKAYCREHVETLGIRTRA